MSSDTNQTVTLNELSQKISEMEKFLEKTMIEEANAKKAAQEFHNSVKIIRKNLTSAKQKYCEMDGGHDYSTDDEKNSQDDEDTNKYLICIKCQLKTIKSY